MRLRVIISDADASDSVLAESVQVTQSISDRVSTASFAMKLEGLVTNAVYDTAVYDTDVYGVDVRELQDVRIEEWGTAKRIFAGTVRQIKPNRKRKDLVLQNCDCQDYTTYLDEAFIQSETFAPGTTDQQIIIALATKYAPQLIANTSTVAVVDTLSGGWSVLEKTFHEALDELIEITGGDYRVDYTKTLRYFEASPTAAPFGFSNTPNYSTTFPIDAEASYTRDAIKLVNRCTVLGAVMPGGQRLKVTYDDPISQATYGIRATTVIDDQQTVGATAILKAQAVVEQNANPLETISLKTQKDGLEAGMSLAVTHSTYRIAKSYLIYELSLQQRSQTLTEYSVSLGARPPDTLRLLKQIDARSRRNTASPVAVPANGTVTNSSISGTGLDVNNLYGTITGTDVIIDAAVVAGSISGTNVTVDAKAIQGVITGTNVAVDVKTFQGAIISSQVADNLIDRLSLYKDSLRPIPDLSYVPALPSADYPNGAIYRNTDDGQFYENRNGTWGLTDQNSVFSGRVNFYHVGSINAGSIVGAIIAAQINSVNAGSIVGQISSDHIGTVNASAITGVIDAVHIGGVHADLIQGSIVAGQITSVNGATINAGSIVSTSIGSVNGGTINIGTVDDSKIASVSANKLTVGTINCSLINVININAANITVGNLSATRIGAGTISASITIISPDIQVNGASSNVHIGPTVIDPTYGVVSVQATDSTGAAAYLVSRGVVVWQGGFKIASINRSPTWGDGGEMALYSGNVITILADGHSGIVRASGFQTFGSPGVSTNINYTKPGGITGQMVFQGGIMTSFT
jgi:hypothetical protein